jgi:cystathionine beta-lyase
MSRTCARAARRTRTTASFYGRRGTPTQWSLADALTELEPGAEATLLYPSGVAAIATTLLALLSPGDHLLIPDSTYDPTRNLANGMLKRMGIETTYYDPLIGDGIAALCRENTEDRSSSRARAA